MKITKHKIRCRYSVLWDVKKQKWIGVSEKYPELSCESKDSATALSIIESLVNKKEGK